MSVSGRPDAPTGRASAYWQANPSIVNEYEHAPAGGYTSLNASVHSYTPAGTTKPIRVPVPLDPDPPM